MFNLYTVIIPLAIVLLGYSFSKPKPKKASDKVTMAIKTLPWQFCYLFLICYLESERVINSGWASFTLALLLIPISALLLLLKLYYFIRARKKHKLT